MKGGTHDVVHTLRLLERFAPHSRRSLVLVGLTSFLSGLTEAGTLVLLNSAAVATTREDDTTTIAAEAL